MATRNEVKAGVGARDVDLPAGKLFSMWTPILAGVLSAVLSVIVLLQE
jgi:hypothetical protein